MPHMKELDYLHLEDFPNYEFELYLKQPLPPSQQKNIDAYHTSSYRLTIETGRRPTIVIPRNNKNCATFVDAM
jgi:hypothetical protein